MTNEQRVFGPRYREAVTLDDGSTAVLRLVTPADRQLLIDGFARMSMTSRYRRFFTAKTQLSPAEVRYLTEMDGERHLALGAVRTLADGSEQGLGVARFIRIAEEPTVAEPAVAVVDEMQGKGLGRLLLVRLVAAAAERGIERFRCHVLADNAPMHALLDQLEAVVSKREGDDLCLVEVDLPAVRLEPPTGIRQTALYRGLSLAAHGALKLRRAFSWLDSGERAKTT